MDGNVTALKHVYAALGGAPENVSELSQNAEVISMIAGVISIKPVTIEPDAQTNEYWGTAVSAMQDTDIAVTGNVISGTLKYVAEGALVTGWNSHHFMALKFTDPNDADDIKVGIKGLVSLDPDMIAVIAVESNEQVLRVQSTKGSIVRTQKFSLSGLTLSEE